MTEQLDETQVLNKYNQFQQNLKAIATKMADLEGDVEEHKLFLVLKFVSFSIFICVFYTQKP